MLILTRRVGERIRVRIQLPGGGVIDGWVVLTEILNCTARFGLAFPPDVEIEREEILPEAEHFHQQPRYPRKNR